MGRDFSVVGRALAVPARSEIVNALMDGSSRPASELARCAEITPSTASEHLAVLVDAGVLRYESHSRHRFYRIADRPIAEALEQLGQVCPVTSAPKSYRRSREARELARARLCYDHLAGRVGVDLVSALHDSYWIDDGWALTDTGKAGFRSIGIDVEAIAASRRPLTRACPDWTERRNHLAGALGAAVATHFITQGWVLRRHGGRGLVISDAGELALREHWGIAVAEDEH